MSPEIPGSAPAGYPNSHVVISGKKVVSNRREMNPW